MGTKSASVSQASSWSGTRGWRSTTTAPTPPPAACTTASSQWATWHTETTRATSSLATGRSTWSSRGGVNIYPAEVEAVLHAHPAVMDAAVIGVPDDQWGESVKAVIQLRPGASATAEELIAFCDKRMAGYKKPRSVDFVDELPRDAAGKLLN